MYIDSQIGPECCLLATYKIVVYKQPLHVAIKTRTQTSLHDELLPRQVKYPNALNVLLKRLGSYQGFELDLKIREKKRESFVIFSPPPNRKLYVTANLVNSIPQQVDAGEFFPYTICVI